MLTKFCHQFTPYITWNCFMLVYLMLKTWWLSSSFSECTPVCSTFKTDCHDMTEVFLLSCLWLELISYEDFDFILTFNLQDRHISPLSVTGASHKLRRFWLYFYITYKIDILLLCQWPVFHISYEDLDFIFTLLTR